MRAPPPVLIYINYCCHLRAQSKCFVPNPHRLQRRLTLICGGGETSVKCGQEYLGDSVEVIRTHSAGQSKTHWSQSSVSPIQYHGSPHPTSPPLQCNLHQPHWGKDAEGSPRREIFGKINISSLTNSQFTRNHRKALFRALKKYKLSSQRL